MDAAAWLQLMEYWQGRKGSFDAAPRASPSVVVLTLYVIRDDADQRRLFECMQTGHRAAT